MYGLFKFQGSNCMKVSDFLVNFFWASGRINFKSNVFCREIEEEKLFREKEGNREKKRKLWVPQINSYYIYSN